MDEARQIARKAALLQLIEDQYCRRARRCLPGDQALEDWAAFLDPRAVPLIVGCPRLERLRLKLGSSDA